MAPRRRGGAIGEQRLPVLAPRTTGRLPIELGNTIDSERSSEGSEEKTVPARSKTGCWNCRDRKIKCDEAKPTCMKCSGKGLACNYAPVWKWNYYNDKIVERLGDCQVWDSHLTEYGFNQTIEDPMPPFQTLTTDNERERKAEYHRPGTYIVLALQETFANSAEYREKDRIFQPNSSRDPHIFHYEPGSTPLPLIESGDPDIVILPAFDGNVESGIQMENSPSPAETTLAEASSTQTLHNDGFLDSPVPHICVPETLRRGDSQCMDCYQHLELPCLPNLRQVYQNMVLLARKVGQLSRRLRAEFEFQMNIGSDQLYGTHRQCQVVGMLELLHSEHMGWYPHFPELAMSYQNRPQLPAGVADYLDQAYVLFRLLQIYTSTSVYPHQAGDILAGYETELAIACTEIIQLAQCIVDAANWQLRFIVFPLFLAGFATRDVAQKRAALNLLEQMAKHSDETKTAAMWSLLNDVVWKQQMAMERGERPDVDWVEEMMARSPGIVMFGL